MLLRLLSAHEETAAHYLKHLDCLAIISIGPAACNQLPLEMNLDFHHGFELRAGRSDVPVWTCRSTAVEVGLKMAMRKFRADNGNLQPCELQVVGNSNGYHGDTLGAMDAVAPSPFNGPEHMPW